MKAPNKDMGKMFDLLKEGLEEAIEFHRGNIKLPTKEVFIPDAPERDIFPDLPENNELVSNTYEFIGHTNLPKPAK